MHKFTGLSGIVMLLAVVGVATAATVQKGNNGDLRVSPATSWENVGVVVPPDVLAYGNVWKKAYRHPGVIVPIRAHDKYTREGLFHIRKTRVVDVGIVYDVKKSVVRVVRNIALTHQDTFTPYFGIWLITMIFLFLVFRKARRATNDADKEKIYALASMSTLLMVSGVVTMAVLILVTELFVATVGATVAGIATALFILYTMDNLPESPLMRSCVAVLMTAAGALFLAI